MASALVVAGATYASVDKAVTLSVDGHVLAAHVLGSSVSDLLATQHIRVGSHDLVSPAPAAALADGQAVVVRYGRLLSVTVDGVARQYWTTVTTVQAALAEIGVRDAGATLSVSRSQPLGRAGLALSITTPKAVTIKVDKTSLHETTTARSVQTALAQAHVRLGKNDRVTPGVSAPLSRSGLTITVQRVAHKRVQDTQVLHHGTVRHPSAALLRGQTRTMTRGRDGAKGLTYAETWVDGRRTARTVTGTRTTRQPVTAVVEVGTKAPVARVARVARVVAPVAPVAHHAPASHSPAPAPAHRSSGSSPRSSSTPTRPSSGGHHASSDGLDWAALARCESGGNPRAVNGAGYYGLYQFSLGTWASVGGSGNPINASSGEQTYRAQILYGRTGAGSWPVCGRQL